MSTNELSLQKRLGSEFFSKEAPTLRDIRTEGYEAVYHHDVLRMFNPDMDQSSVARVYVTKGYKYDFYALGAVEPDLRIYDKDGKLLRSNSIENDDDTDWVYNQVQFLKQDSIEFNNLVKPNTPVQKHGLVPDTIEDWVAPYTGVIYVDGNFSAGGSVLHDNLWVGEDRDGQITPFTEPQWTADKVFDWGERTYSDLLPGNATSTTIAGYYARLYSNNNAVGVKDGNVYFYDGVNSFDDGQIYLVGTLSSFASEAK